MKKDLVNVKRIHIFHPRFVESNNNAKRNNNDIFDTVYYYDGYNKYNGVVWNTTSFIRREVPIT